MAITRFVSEEKSSRFDDVNNPKRVYPVDKWEIPKALLDRASRYHFLRVPLLGQMNPQGRGDDWCGRTSSCMVYNYRKLALGEIGSDRDNYVTQWDNGDGKRMDLRHQDGSIAAAGYSLDAVLNRVGVKIEKKPECKIKPGPKTLDRTELAKRASEATAIAKDPKELRKHFAAIIESLAVRNNPMVFYTGFSVTGRFRSHIIVIAGFCELRDGVGGDRLWLLIADPGGPKIGKIFTPPSDSTANDVNHLDALHEERNNIIRLVDTERGTAKGSLYLVRASHLFARNTVFPDDNTLWMDYTYDNNKNGLCEELGGTFSYCGEKTPSDAETVISNLDAHVCYPFQRETSALESPVAQLYSAERPKDTPRNKGGILPPTQEVARPSLAEAWGYYPLSSSGMVHSGVRRLCDRRMSASRGRAIHNIVCSA